MKNILIIDDERSIRNTLKEILEYENNKVEAIESGKQAIELIKKQEFDIVFCDIKMPEIDGIEVLKEIHSIKPEMPIIMISGHGNIETAVEAIKLGAYDFIQKPLDLNRILVTIKNATEKTELISETKNLKKKIGKNFQMIGNSEQIFKVKEMIEKIAPTDARVLITGSNGTGKEVVANWIYTKSNRANNPFIEVNCAAIPSELIESELFGHEKGAFTSAHIQRKGKFEQANEGTIFLDEVGDMSLSAQAKVLRALQENKITRVGSDKDIKVDVRVIAATNKNLKQEIENKTFREDLYHRLSVIIINVPDLNDRKDDIPLLISYFISQICEEQGIKLKNISSKAIEKLKQYNWTGNIRELRNVIERLVILSSEEITEKDVENYVLIK
jgi:DNA-binding NtrC family response regulator